MASKRKYVSTACDTCRESKVKCDGTRPACSNCQHKMRPCNYQVGMDKRKISLKFVVDLLINRVDELSQFIVEQGLGLPPTFNANDIALKNALESLGLRHIKIALEEIEKKKIQPEKARNDQTGSLPYMGGYTVTDNFDTSEVGPATELLIDPFAASNIGSFNQMQLQHEMPLDSSDDGSNKHTSDDGNTDEYEILQYHPEQSADFENAIHLSPSQRLDKGPEFLQHENRDQKPSDGLGQLGSDTSPESAAQNPTEDDSDIESMIHRLSDRMGSLQVGSDGKIRYYGPTSHFNLLRMPTPDKLTVHRTVRKDGNEYLERMGLDKEIPQSLEDHLINLFFVWHSPTVDVVSRGVYEMAKQQWKEHGEETVCYSEALTNAMCCLGAAFEPRYHPTFVTYPKSLSDFFADRAKTFLDIELDSPTIATVQAMVVLSGHDIGCQRDSRGWLYSGMAMRLAFDLGLHLDMTSYVRDGTINEAEADLRSIVFWGAYALDHHWGFLLGRPSRISLEDVTAAKPSLNLEGSQSHSWYPYGLPFSTSYPLGKTLFSPSTLLSRYRIELCDIMTPLGHALYGSSQIPKQALQLLNEKTTRRLLSWKAELPVLLQINDDTAQTPPLPHILLLHLHYQQSMIHAHRPWMSQKSLQPQPQQGPGFTHARKMCISSALSIAEILRLYERYYSFRRMNIQAVAITCSAALILIFAKILDAGTHEDPTSDINPEKNTSLEPIIALNICFRALEEFGSSWESAKRAQSFLLRMQELMALRCQPGRPTKRHLDQASPSDTKRTRKSFINQPQNSESSSRIDTSEDFDWLWATAMGAVPSRC